MPVGIPKVPFRYPGDEDAHWVDLHHRLNRKRILLLFKDIDEELASQTMGLLVFLSMEDNTEDQFVVINSRGGSVVHGMGIHDTMKGVKADVNTIGLGVVVSMASFILSGGESTKRTALPNVRIMMHQPATSFFDSSTSKDLVMSVGELTRLRDSLLTKYTKNTGKPYWVIAADLEREVFMSATEAQAYGIVDRIGQEKEGLTRRRS